MTFRALLMLFGCLLGSLSVVVLSAAVAAAEEGKSATITSDPSPDAPPPSRQEILNWIEQLDSDKFLVRETATQNLMRAKDAAIPLLSDAVRSGSLEKAIRCIHVLRGLAVGDDMQTEIEATAKLNLIAETENDRIAAYAADVLKKIQPLRQERAIRILSGLGVRFSTYAPEQAFQAGVSGPGVVIDTDFQGTAEDLYYLQHLQFIEDVQIAHPEVTAEWLAHVAKMPSVYLMSIKDAPLDAEMLRELEPLLPRLQRVRLYYFNLEDSAIPVIGKMSSLVYGEFYGLRLTQKQRDALRAALPGTANLEFREGGFLGVSGGRNSGGPCLISTVHEDSGAYEAGLRGGDIVTEVDGNAVESFPHLIDLLREKTVGDAIKMKVLRGEEPLEFGITLGKYPLQRTYGP